MPPALTFRSIAVVLCLLISVLCCGLGTVGMWRMRTPTQSLHYTGLPGTLGVVALVFAVLLKDGSTVMFWKTVLIAIIFFAVNSVEVHAAARAFRSREVGHWEPRDGDPHLEKLRTLSPPGEAGTFSQGPR